MSEVREALHWGINEAMAGVPEDARATWGCRAIATATGRHDVLGDRVDCQGTDADRQRLLQLMSDRIPLDVLSERSRRADEDSVSRVYDDREIAVRTRLAGGYCYVTAWLRPTPDPEAKTDCPLCGGEGWIGGLIIGDDQPSVEQRCGQCKGAGTVTNAEYDAFMAERSDA